MLAPGDEIRGNAAVRTERGGRATLRLANGVELRLDAGTEVRFPAAAAVALDRGGIFVDTGAAGAERRVEIRTSAGIARDVGTAFEVRMVADAMRVRVRDGLVNLESGGAIHQAGRAVELIADQSGVARRPVALDGSGLELGRPRGGAVRRRRQDALGVPRLGGARGRVERHAR